MGFFKNFIIRKFYEIFYFAKKTQKTTSWLGVRTRKIPTDLWIFQEIIYETKPDLIIESGTKYGGSALFMATILDAVGQGRIISVDIRTDRVKAKHPRITFLEGSSTDENIFNKIKSMIRAGEKVMVVLDSDHSREHVLKELEIYSKFVTPGNYLIVEDTNEINYYDSPEMGQSAKEALEEFLGRQNDFEADRSREKFIITSNPGGFLKRK